MHQSYDLWMRVCNSDVVELEPFVDFMFLEVDKELLDPSYGFVSLLSHVK